MSGFNMDEMMKAFGQMKMPDMQAFAEAQRRNLEAMATANRVALEGAQAVARRNMEIMQQAIAEMTEAAQKLASAESSPQAKAAQQAELLKGAYERAVANMREIAELIHKSNGEAVGVLNKRFTEAMDEVKGLMKP